MRNLFIILLLLAVSPSTYSQTVKVQNGIAFSSMDSEKIELLNDRINTYSAGIGIDYLNRKYFVVSSELNYISKGGSEDLSTLNNVQDRITEKFSYLNINTTFRLKYDYDFLSYVYIGLGPKIDLLIDDKDFKSPLFSSYKMNGTSFGLKTELGVSQTINERFMAGLGGAYFVNFGSVGKSQYNTLSQKTFSLMLYFGYVIR